MTTLTEYFACLEPIRALSDLRRRELVGFSHIEDFPLGCDPLLACREGNRLVYLVSGELLVSQPDGSMRVLVGGCDMANWPLGRSERLPKRSKAITRVELLLIDFELLDIVITWDELTAMAAKQHAASDESTTPAWNDMAHPFSAQVLNSDALRRLPAAHIHELLQRFERRPVVAGETIVREGDKGEDYFMIESGRAEVHRLVGGVDLSVAEIKGGDAFGEESLLSDSPRNASITMKSDGVLLRLSKPDFFELMRAPLLHVLTREVAEQRIAAGTARWLDVRYPAEFAENSLPGAINLPLNEIRAAFGLLDPGLEYIAYCQSGRRSSAAAFLLAQHGLKAAMLAGGLAGEVNN